MADSYKNAGVDIHAGYEAVNRIKKHAARTAIPGAMGGLGGFGAMFDLSLYKNYNEPVLVSGTDGVGTKLMLAFEMGKHDTIGVDAVAMCANDIVTVNAKPLFFLDYIACGKVIPDTMEAIISGIADGCEMAGCALIGGEMAEHPGMMPADEYDIAGFCVGIAEKSKILTGGAIKPGDKLIGIASSGVHSNGFSLIRKIIKDNALSLSTAYTGKPLGEELLTPTKIYVKPLLSLCADPATTPKAMSHITGGGFIENIPRMFGEGLGAEIITGTWEIPQIFTFLQEKGNIPQQEIYNLYNMGIGMVLAAEESQTASIISALEAQGEKAWVIGSVTQGESVKII